MTSSDDETQQMGPLGHNPQVPPSSFPFPSAALQNPRLCRRRSLWNARLSRKAHRGGVVPLDARFPHPPLRYYRGWSRSVCPRVLLKRKVVCCNDFSTRMRRWRPNVGPPHPPKITPPPSASTSDWWESGNIIKTTLRLSRCFPQVP